MKELLEYSDLEAATELDRLASVIRKHNFLYHDLDSPEISDSEYDELIKHYRILENKFPHLVVSQSPSKQVGSTPSARFNTVSHVTPMLSLDNAFTPEDVDKWVQKICDFVGLSRSSLAVTSEFKFDGLSVSLRYEKGILVLAATRGDGLHGEDLTKNAKYVTGIPGKISGAVPDVLEVRGEIYMDKETFLNLNSSGIAGRTFANPRNAAAGSFRQKDTSKVAQRGLKFAFHGIGECSSPLKSHWALIVELLKSWGFGYVNTNHGTPVWTHDGSIDSIMNVFNHIQETRSALPFDIDGVVHKVADIKLRDRLGSGSHSPRWAIAHKFDAEKATTTILDIDIQIGRTGRITPVARLSPINVGGIVISNATCHNVDYVKNKDLRIGDMVIVQRAGDVIPQIIGLSPLNCDHNSRQIWMMPEHCPSCGSIVTKDQNESDSYCSGGLRCHAQIIERLKHLVSRDALDIDGIGEEVIKELHREKMITYPADIFRLKYHRNDLLNKDGWGEASVENILNAIEASRETTADRALYAIGIRLVGRNVTKELSYQFGDLDSILKHLLDLDNWIKEFIRNNPKKRSDLVFKLASEKLNIPGIGPNIIRNLLGFITDQGNVKIASDLWSELYIKPLERPLGTSSSITGKTLVFSGHMETMSREEAKVKAEAMGAKVVGSVSDRTDILIAGPGAGNKLSKAKSLNITTMNEDEWLALISIDL